MGDIQTIQGIPVDSIRRVPIKEGIKIDRTDLSYSPEDKAGRIIGGMPLGGVRFIRYEPGNGTRYDLYFFSLEPFKPYGKIANATQQFVMLHDNGGEGGRSARIPLHGVVDPSYLREKLSCSETDSLVLSELTEFLFTGMNRHYGLDIWIERENS